MVHGQPSPRVCKLIREAARIALAPSSEWLDEYDRATLAADPAIAEDPALAGVVSRANRANLLHFAMATLRNPGAPVPPNLGAEPVRMARDLARRGLARLAPDIYRIGQNVASRRWSDIAFGLTSDPQELRELLDVAFRSADDFIDATIVGVAAQIPLEHQELTRDIGAQRRKFVEQIIDDASINRAHAEAQLGYFLDRSHTAAIIWSEEPDDDHDHLDKIADAVSDALRCDHPLTVVASAATRWVWLNDVTPDVKRIHQVFSSAPKARIAIGTTAPGIDGFRRSFQHAHTTQRMVTRLRSPQRVTFFADVQLIELLTQSHAGTDEFIKSTLGDFESASATLHTTLLTFINQHCNASRTAKRLYIHRNTLMNRLETAQQLLPRPLDDTTVDVAVAIRALQWRG